MEGYFYGDVSTIGEPLPQSHQHVPFFVVKLRDLGPNRPFSAEKFPNFISHGLGHGHEKKVTRFSPWEGGKSIYGEKFEDDSWWINRGKSMIWRVNRIPIFDG